MNTVATTEADAKRSRLWWGVAFVAAMGAAGGAVNSAHLGFVGSAAVILVPMLLLIPFVRATERAQAATGCISPAMQRYNRRVLLFAFAYVAALFAAIGVHGHLGVEGPLLWLVALVPPIPILGLIWAMARLLIEERDEYQRMRMIRAALIATAVLLVTATIWGFLEMFDLAPHVWVWAAFPAWSIGLGIGQLANPRFFGDPGGC